MDLHKIGTNVEFGNAVDQAIADGVDIISASIVWLIDGPGDGTGFLSDIAKNARQNGIFYAAAAGNNAENCWSGTFTNIGDDSHAWAPGQNVNYFGPGTGSAYVIPAGVGLAAGLHWDDWTMVDQDYDLFLLGWTGSQWVTVASSVDLQDGGSGQMPIEYISAVTPFQGPYGWYVDRWDSTRNVCFRLITSHTATPHVSGAAALVRQAYGNYTVAQLQQFLETRAIDLGAAGKDNLFGAGRLYLGPPADCVPSYIPAINDLIINEQ